MRTDIQHTLAIFEQLHKALPPLVPDRAREELAHALEHVRSDASLTLAMLEDTMIVFGKKLWPYRRAFQEFVDLYEGKLGEKMFVARLSIKLKRRYKEFQAHGGDFRDLHAGGPLGFFTPDERLELCGALVAARTSVRDHAMQAALSTDRDAYEERIEEFQDILSDIEKRLDSLRQTADREQEHPELAAEIRAQIRAFEYGLCALGPRIDYDAVCRADEHFEGRRQEKKMYRSLM
ncbi:MAG: hypothetical protein A3C90_01535 [Candidatus Magasanikbacteria bacterium RIFCSPHIGHO2_02_FULL_51_14]|uniref:Uncharacterized protein n=1 Tax=Candidatus Magasanikbacteria bacterium RIFCSPHIGHO2_02_FULL_51_14 TaxID=1798683 RepID=A0A1F6MHH7_9BACT|nr:MAG: hypothetical protein A3C90_01535 [Candidatus Magasanikbacteria bacterium RIFCSPHIGHO2_02_FULL_51_14]